MLSANVFGLALRDVHAALDEAPALPVVKADLARLKLLGLVHTGGHGRGAVWMVLRPSARGGA